MAYIHFNHNFDQTCSIITIIIIDSCYFNGIKYTASGGWIWSINKKRTKNIVYLHTSGNLVKIIATEKCFTFIWFVRFFVLRWCLIGLFLFCSSILFKELGLAEKFHVNCYDNKRHCWNHICIERAKSVRISMQSKERRESKKKKKEKGQPFSSTNMTYFHVPIQITTTTTKINIRTMGTCIVTA